MAIASPYTIDKINHELGNAVGTNISLNDTRVRALCGKSSGGISLSDSDGTHFYDVVLNATYDTSSVFGNTVDLKVALLDTGIIHFISVGAYITPDTYRASLDRGDGYFDSSKYSYTIGAVSAVGAGQSVAISNQSNWITSMHLKVNNGSTGLYGELSRSITIKNKSTGLTVETIDFTIRCY